MRVLPRTCLIRGFCSCVDCIRDQFSCKTLAAYSTTNFKQKKKHRARPTTSAGLDGCDVQRNGAGVSTARLRRPAQIAGAVSLTSCAKRWRRDAHVLRPRGGPNVPRQARASGRLRRPAQGAGVSTARLRRPAQSAGAVPLTSRAKRWRRDAHELQPRCRPKRPATKAGVWTAATSSAGRRRLHGPGSDVRRRAPAPWRTVDGPLP